MTCRLDRLWPRLDLVPVRFPLISIDFHSSDSYQLHKTCRGSFRWALESLLVAQLALLAAKMAPK